MHFKKHVGDNSNEMDLTIYIQFLIYFMYKIRKIMLVDKF